MNGSLEIAAKAQMIAAAPDTLRHMLIITSNAYRDREGEIVSQKALEGYVESCWKGDEFVGDNPLLLWHGGDPIGEIIYADMEGPFLIEVARELPNQVVNLAREDEEPISAEIKSVWDALENERSLGASHEFMYVATDREDGIYDLIVKKESTVLPDWAAANYFTDAEIIRGIK